MKIISYSLFGEQNYDRNNKFVFDKYLLGVYFNARMNKLIYPEWKTVVHLDSDIHEKYTKFFIGLFKLFGVSYYTMKMSNQLCRNMLYRTLPIFNEILGFENPSHVLCRDLDALTSYREASYVNDWLKSGKAVHQIHDNPAHSGLMGGLIGFDVKQFHQRFPEYNTFDKLIENFDLSKHGSDQNLLNLRIAPKIEDSILISDKNSNYKKDSNLWQSDLCSFFIGSAGANEMELLRFFQSFDEDQKYYDFEDEFSDICYWRR